MSFFAAAVSGPVLVRLVLVLTGTFVVGALLLANGLLALASPRKWARARWTATRGFNRDADSFQEFLGIRLFGGVLSAGGAFFLYQSCRAVIGVLRGYSVH